MCLLALSPLGHARLNVEQRNTSGIASYYGKREQGRKTASGERFDRNKYTAASRYYRLGTILNVTYPKTGVTVMVRVTDRGPWVQGRVLDLSERAAQSLGLRAHGLGYIQITPVHLWGLQ